MKLQDCILEIMDEWGEAIGKDLEKWQRVFSQ